MKAMKKNGISKDVMKVFYKGLDPFIDDDYEPEEDDE